MSRKVELLAPAGSMDSLKAAVAAGADAVYMGGMKFGARAFAENFEEDQLIEAIHYIHLHNKKLYLTVNTLLKNKELNQLYDYLLPYYEAGLNGVIVQDLGVVRYIRRMFPDMEVHASTQMTLTGSNGARLMKEHGLTRIVPARELSLREIKKIKEETGIEIECFIHGALCYCYSGQCLLSSMIGGRSGNRGQCAQPCRLPYKIGNKTEDFMSLKDLCTLDILPDLMEAGIDSFKIEGRMKHPSYVYHVVQIYRKYIDLYESGKTYKVSQNDKAALLSAFQRRGYTDGYYFRHNGKEMISFKRPKAEEHTADLTSYDLQRPVHGILYIRLGEPMQFTVYDHEYCISVKGSTPEPAMKQPLDESRIAKQMKKTGGTSFTFDSMTIDMEEDIFLPMQALNEIRREGLEAFYEEILKSHERTAYIDKETPFIQPQSATKEFTLSAFVTTFEQLKAALATGKLSQIYVDSSIALEKSLVEFKSNFKNVEFYYVTPFICREKTVRTFLKLYSDIEKEYDGIILRSLELLPFFKEKGYQKKIISDYNLYTFNAEAEQFMSEIGFHKFTASVELNERELNELGMSEHIYIAYGYQPVMITANCLVKNSQGCKNSSSILKISDRYNKVFSVYTNCSECYNVIYNTSPLYLADLKDKLRSIGAGEYRLDFTMESYGDVKKIIQNYHSCLFDHVPSESPYKEITRGHLKRGVK